VRLNHLLIFVVFGIVGIVIAKMGITSRAHKSEQQGTLTQEKRALLQDPPSTQLISPTPNSTPSPTRRRQYSTSHLHPRYKAANEEMSKNKASEKKPSPAVTLDWVTTLIRSLSPSSMFTTFSITKTKSKDATESRSGAETTLRALPVPPALPSRKQASLVAPHQPTQYTEGTQFTETTTTNVASSNRERSQSPRPFGGLRDQASQIFRKGSVPDSSMPVVLPSVPQEQQILAWFEHPDGAKVEYDLNFMFADHVSALSLDSRPSLTFNTESSKLGCGCQRVCLPLPTRKWPRPKFQGSLANFRMLSSAL